MAQYRTAICWLQGTEKQRIKIAKTIIVLLFIIDLKSERT